MDVNDTGVREEDDDIGDICVGSVFSFEGDCSCVAAAVMLVDSFGFAFFELSTISFTMVCNGDERTILTDPFRTVVAMVSGIFVAMVAVAVVVVLVVVLATSVPRTAARTTVSALLLLGPSTAVADMVESATSLAVMMAFASSPLTWGFCSICAHVI